LLSQHQFENLSDNDIFPSLKYSEVFEDSRGYIWLGTEGDGLIRYDGLNMNYFQYSLIDSFSLPSNNILFIGELVESQIFIGTRNGACVIDKSGNLQRILFIDSLNVEMTSIQEVYNISKLVDGSLMFATNAGLIYKKLEDEFFTQFEIPAVFTFKPLMEKTAISILQDNNNSDIIWVGTAFGLKRFDFRIKEFQTIKNPAKWHRFDPLADQYAMYALHQTKEGYLYMAASWSGGIMMYDPQKAKWKHYLYPGSSKASPYFGNAIHYINALNDSIIHYSCNAGSGFFNSYNNIFSPFQIEDSNPKDKSNTGATIDRFGYAWYASYDGIFKSKKAVQEIKNDKNLYVPIIRSITSNTGVVKYKDHEFELGKESNRLNFDVGIINLPISQNIEYKWKLIGHDKMEQFSNLPGSIHYSDLRSGSYKLTYSMRRKGSLQWLDGKPVSFRITVPFYKTNWFYIICLIFSMYLVYQILQKKAKKIREDERLKLNYEHQIAEVKMSALRAQMNPHFLFNTMNSINHYILQNNPDLASYFLTRFSKLIRQVLNNSKESNVLLSNEMEAMNIYIEMEQLRFDNAFEYQLYVEDNIDMNHIRIPSLLIQPYIENAIWHGLMHKDGKGKLNISIALEDNTLEVSIRDNGIGRDASQKSKSNFLSKKSYGMVITKDRLELVNKMYDKKSDLEIIDLKDANGQAMGTEVILHIPIL
jgi:hypothetical protein